MKRNDRVSIKQLFVGDVFYRISDKKKDTWTVCPIPDVMISGQFKKMLAKRESDKHPSPFYINEVVVFLRRPEN